MDLRNPIATEWGIEIMKANEEDQTPFWEYKTLDQMTREEWESLCDGCAKCCLHKIEDQDSRKVYFTNVACRLLDCLTCLCLDYDHRTKRIPDCVPLTPSLVQKLSWLPKSCAYRRLAEGKNLAWWHPLICGNQYAVHQSENSIFDKVIPESAMELSALEDYIVDWID